MNFKIIIPILIYILIIIIAITAIILLFYYKPFDSFFKKKNTYYKIQANIDKLYLKEQKKEKYVSKPEDATTDSKLVKQSPIEEKKLTSETKDNEQNKNQKQMQAEKLISKTKEVKNISNKQQATKKDSIPTKEITKETYSKGSSLPDQSFDSYGEYISAEEYNYRLTLIKNLIIKTVIIDKLTTGNGISQEFFKVVYQNKMIPSKILEEIVESKEFRNLIPAKFRKEEIKINGLGKGETVTFKNQIIKELLILWSYGKLTPIQKAWKVKAER